MRLRRGRAAAGFTLIELAVVLVLVGLLIVIAAMTIPRLTERQRLDTTRDRTLDDVAQALVEFAAANGRLPCADTSVPANGLEGSGAVSSCGVAPADRVGRVPYRALGFSDPVLDEAHLPVRYAVYRGSAAGSADADLASLSNRFIPVLPGTPATVDHPIVGGSLESEGPPNIISEGLNPTRKMPANENDLDLCLALRNAKAAVATTGQVHTLDLGGATPSFNSAFVLASGGVEDADGDAADMAFDGANEGAGGVDFESPARRRDGSNVAASAYDDVVYAMPFDLLESKLSCAAITIGVNAAANVANAAALMVTQTEDIVWQAERNTAMDDISVAIASLSLALAILDTATAIADGVMFSFNTACPPTASDGPGIPFAVATGVASAAAAIVAGVALGEAIGQVALNDAVLAQAVADAVVTNDIANRVCTDAVNADERGGQGNAPATPASPADRP